MKFFCLRVVLATICSVHSTTDMINRRDGSRSVKLISGSSFIIDCDENKTFMAFLDENRSRIEESLLDQQRKGLLDCMQNHVLKYFQNEVVETTAIHCYNEYNDTVESELECLAYAEDFDHLDDENANYASYQLECFGERKKEILLNVIKSVYIEEMDDDEKTSIDDKVLRVSNVLISKIPMMGLRFSKYGRLSLYGAGITDGVEELAELKHLKYINLGHNSITNFPDLSRFGELDIINLGYNREMKIAMPESIRFNSKIKEVRMYGTSGVKLYAARLRRAYKDVRCDEIEHYNTLKVCGSLQRDVFKQPDTTPLNDGFASRFEPRSTSIYYHVCNRDVLEFRAKYYDDFTKNMCNVVNRLKIDFSEKLNILSTNQFAIHDIIDLIIIDYYNRYYIQWWNKLDGLKDSDVVRELRDDIREADLLNFPTLELQNTTLSRVPLDAFKFLDRRDINLCNTSISEDIARDIMKLLKVNTVTVRPNNTLALWRSPKEDDLIPEEI